MRVFNRYFSTYDLVLCFGDVALTLLCAGMIRAVTVFAGIGPESDFPQWTLKAAVMPAVVVVGFYYSDLYFIDQTLSRRELLLRFLSGFGLVCIVTGVISYPIPNLAKGIYLSEMVLMGVALFTLRLGLMAWIQQARIRAKVLILGNRAIGRLVAEELYRHRKLGMEVVGFVSNQTGEISLSYGNPKHISLPMFLPSSVPSLVTQKGVDRILLAGADGLRDLPFQELLELRMRGIAIEDCHSFYERLMSKIAIADLSPEWLLMSGGFRRSRIVRVTKRAIDVIAAIVGLFVSTPIVLFTAIAIKLESSGSLLYRQERVGKDERHFTLYKFRSMRVDAEPEGKPVWAAEEDPRTTRVGKIIRKLRIDEIPQMINVLKGEMSFVGPRPERPFFVEELKKTIPYYYLRMSVKPGITGWAQICYPYADTEEAAVEKLEYDLYYIKNVSALFDLQIILESFKVILWGRGAR